MPRPSSAEVINEAFKHCKPIGATDEGLDPLKASSIKGMTFADQKGGGGSLSWVWWLSAMQQTWAHSSPVQKAIAEHRHWDREKKMADQVPARPLGAN